MKKVISLALVGIMLLSSFTFAGTKVTGYDEFGYNYNARIFNGTMEQYYAKRGLATPEYEFGVSLIMKWSKNFVIQNYNENSWLTNHYTWYTDDYMNDETYFGYEDVNYGIGKYRVEEFTKMKSYDPEYPPENLSELVVIWGNFVIEMDVVKVFDAQTGALLDVIEISEKSSPGLGNLKY